MTSIESLKNGRVQKGNMLDVKVVKKVAEEYYIVADETEHTLLVSPQELKEGSTYKLIKPSYADSELRKNPKFAVVKVERDIKTKPLKKDDEKLLVARIMQTENNEGAKIVNDFGLIEGLGIGGIADEITLMVTNISSIIQGKFGTYRIATCKDIKGKTNSLNLYRNLVDMVNVEDVLVFTKLKVNNFRKEDQDYHRLGTTAGSRITRAGVKEKQKFEAAGVMLGDKVVKGSILGISEVNVYESCSKCWCKIDDEGLCRKCNMKPESKKQDYNLIMYIQNDEDEDDILDLFGFKSTLEVGGNIKGEIDEDALNIWMVGKKCVAEYNIDKNRGDGKYRMVKFLMQEKSQTMH